MEQNKENERQNTLVDMDGNFSAEWYNLITQWKKSVTLSNMTLFQDYIDGSTYVKQLSKCGTEIDPNKGLDVYPNMCRNSS